MADYYVMQGDGEPGESVTYQIAFLIPVPNENNRSGGRLNLQSAVAQDMSRPQSTAVPGMDALDVAAVNAGQKLIVFQSVNSHSAETQESDETLFDSRFNSILSNEQEKIRLKYRYEGHARTVGAVIAFLLASLVGLGAACASDIHVMDASDDGRTLRVAFHVPIPDVPNRAGVSYRVALKEWLDTQDDPSTLTVDEGSQSVVPGISQPEQNQLDNGQIYEVVESFRTHPDHTTGEDRNRLDARYAEVVNEARQALQRKLAYWGFSRDVP